MLDDSFIWTNNHIEDLVLKYKLKDGPSKTLRTIIKFLDDSGKTKLTQEFFSQETKKSIKTIWRHFLLFSELNIIEIQNRKSWNDTKTIVFKENRQWMGEKNEHTND